MKLRSRKTSIEDKTKYLDALYTAIVSLRSRDEIKDFLKDLLTEGERIMIGRRIIIAQQLLMEKSYQEIMDELKVGSDTIARVHRWLDDEIKGYERAVQELEKSFAKRSSRRYNTNIGTKRGKYPNYHIIPSLIAAFKKKDNLK